MHAHTVLTLFVKGMLSIATVCILLFLQVIPYTSIATYSETVFVTLTYVYTRYIAVRDMHYIERGCQSRHHLYSL